MFSKAQIPVCLVWISANYMRDHNFLTVRLASLYVVLKVKNLLIIQKRIRIVAVAVVLFQISLLVPNLRHNILRLGKVDYLN